MRLAFQRCAIDKEDSGQNAQSVGEYRCLTAYATSKMFAGLREPFDQHVCGKRAKIIIRQNSSLGVMQEEL